MIDTKPYRVKPSAKVKLDDHPSETDGGLNKDEAQKLQAKLAQRLQELQELLYAEQKQALLVVLQAMDAGGKDSTIRHVFGPLNPQGCQVVSFKAPNDVELAHDFLWRVHQNLPRRGYMGVFNRSHYEDVLIVRVKNLAPESRWRKRYEHINAFEELLHDEGTRVVKCYLHVSKDYQKQRLQRRLDRPDKHWKFNPDDLQERARWGAYQEAFEEAIERCSTAHAPWYIVPAERRWFRDLLVTQIVVDTLEAMAPQYPEPTFDAADIVIE